jgi:GntR family transcriptional regulator, vanillate catabolism transcriptional regulator
MQTVNSREASDAIEIRSALEGFAARLAAQRGIASAQTALLRQYVASMEKIAVAYGSLSTDMLAQYAKLNASFHAMLFELAQCPALNRQLAGEFQGSLALIDVRAVVKAGSELRSFMLFEQDQHRSLMDAIIQGDGPQAESLAREHGRLSQKYLVSLETATRQRTPSEAL